MSKKKLSVLDKCELFIIRTLKYVPPFRGLYSMNAYLTREVDELYKSIESLIVANTNLIAQVKLHQRVLENHFGLKPKEEKFNSTDETQESDKGILN